MRERALFFVLRRKHLFRTWRLQKSLHAWKATVSGRRFQRRRSDIQESALLAHPPFCRALDMAARLCFQLTGLPVEESHGNGPLRLEVRVQDRVVDNTRYLGVYFIFRQGWGNHPAFADDTACRLPGPSAPSVGSQVLLNLAGCGWGGGTVG
jgi:hypothetical protein